MKKIIFLLFIGQVAFAQEIVSVKISKPYCLFNFMEAASGQSRHISETLQENIKAQLGTDAEFTKLCTEFHKIEFHYQYKREAYPSGRRQYRSIYDLLMIALVRADNLTEFNQNAIGLLPNVDQMKLMEILKAAEKYYDKAIWNPELKYLKKQQRQLSAYSEKATGIFKAARQFYSSGWSDAIPFTVALYPIPGLNGSSTATPHANSLCVGVMTQETDHAGRMGVVLHEMCHVLYDEQPSSFQHQLQSWFSENPSAYSGPAYTYFDEALATAIGNGWATREITGKLDQGEWYNNRYINGFGKALFPMIDTYFKENKVLDKAFVDEAISLFAAAFPESITDYNILLNKVTIYSDNEPGEDLEAMLNNIEAGFRLAGFHLSSPISHPQSLEMMEQDGNTQLFVLDQNQEENLKKMSEKFPELSAVSFSEVKNHLLLAFTDARKRQVIVLISRKKGDLSGLVHQMKNLGGINGRALVQFAD